MAADHGQAGSGIGGQAARARFGSNAAVGAAGERAFAEALRRSKLGGKYDVYYSLSIPDDPVRRNATRYSSDVDVAITSGNRLVLIDVKRWRAGGIYWSLASMPFRGLAPLRLGQDKQWKPLSANMAAALARYRANLPGVEVSAMVIFVGAGPRAALPGSVGLLRWPGGARSYLLGDGLRVLGKRLGAHQPTQVRLRSFLASRTARGSGAR